MMDDCYEKTRETIERMMQQFSMINHQLEPDQFKSIRSGTSRELSLLPVVLEGQKILDELFDYLSHPHLERPIVVCIQSIFDSKKMHKLKLPFSHLI